ncbi:indolepyruvate ferredoxin oxidoreductase, alpha subunit [Thaumarchaeota archaeon SCGC AB-539-E09]|nr:indolepyruvate ferredoxin oxidoreductase, alpha subunit [Thaumarchaeota archaeon SCGC AB-539-E09]
MTRYAYELSERVRLPVMLRTVTRLSHMRSDVALGSIEKHRRDAKFDWEGFSYRVAGFEKLFRRHKERHEKIDRVQREFEDSKFNTLKLDGDEELGVIGVGFSFNYVIDAIKRGGLEGRVAHLKLATPYPLPEDLVRRLMERVERVLVVEEVDPFVELHVKALANDASPGLKVLGRMSGDLPREGELSPMILDDSLGKLLNVEGGENKREDLEREVKDVMFDRMLTLCAGCPHRASIYALKKAVQAVKGDLKSVVVNGDIGCYGLAHAPPMSFEDTYFCMGASIGVSQGMAKVGVDTISWIGDGTFFHAGIPAMINAVVNNAPINIVVADNGIIAMTGFQPTPQSGKTAMGGPAKKISIEDIATAAGVDFLEVVDPFDLDATEKAFKRMLEAEGVSMVIVRRLCAMEALRNMRPNKPVPYVVDEDACVGCKLCLNQLGCPSLIWSETDRKASIDATLCTGCGVCAQVCPQGAILKEDS